MFEDVGLSYIMCGQSGRPEGINNVRPIVLLQIGVGDPRIYYGCRLRTKGITPSTIKPQKNGGWLLKVLNMMVHRM